MTDFEDYGEQYLQQYHAGDFETVLVQIRRKKILESVQRFPHRHILEVGCGLEPLFLAVEGFDTYTVVEPVDSFLKAARSLVPEEKNIRCLSGRLEDRVQDLVTKEFDFILVSSLLHEVPDPDALLESVAQLCRTGTVVHLNVPNVYSFHRLLALEMGLVESIWQKSELEIRFQRHTHFDRVSFEKILTKNGFKVLNFGTYFIKPFSNAQMRALLEHKIADGSLIQGLEGMTKYLPDMGVEMFAEVRKRH